MYPSRMPTVGHRMKTARIAAGFNQSQLATKLGVSRAAISLFESGKTLPSAETLINFATVTGASLDYILLARPISPVDSRLLALPDALREYVLLTLGLAERVRARLPEQFIRPPTGASYEAFHEYLRDLSSQIADHLPPLKH